MAYMDILAIPQNIPTSVLPYPKGVRNRTKYIFWKAIYPVHGVGRELLLSLKLLRHEGRQDYLIGTLVQDRSIYFFVKYLGDQNFLNHFIALRDDDEIVSLRRVVDFEHQYHLRIFSNGEVRGHYEYTPESHPRWHMDKVGQEPRREDFLKFLGDWIVPLESEIPLKLAGEQSSITRIIGLVPFGTRKRKV
jgi:hypothetical protein